MSSSACKNIIILSEKSSGSSACQHFLAEFADVQHVRATRHYENETLYWTKAASILGRPQITMVDSEVPIPRNTARQDLLQLLSENLEAYVPPSDDKTLIMQGWQQLCKRFSPILVEKSPHHLCQWSALELIIECMQGSQDVDFLLIGLIRNPMDTIYSQYSRWQSSPERVEKQWLTAYGNLLRLKSLIEDKVIIVRYEDMVASLKPLEPVFEFCGVTANSNDPTYFHRKSLQKWRSDRLFGYQLSQETRDLAARYGYKDSEVSNRTFPLWPAFSWLWRTTYRSGRTIRRSILGQRDQ